eukprot:TRINITY_DN17253_c0_g1_i1.p1 TRINITY_DN17253_c0_g1~~TRINITY_DN17253_c0_g1_i1.p1  ORF type:complete len:442 (-),score=114.25 TRINITY_DN17253_c0_g1_i1:115-1440(-)
MVRVRVEQLRFLSAQQAWAVKEAHGTPAYVYHQPTLEAQARTCLAVQNPYGVTVRYAAKAWTSRAVIELFESLGLEFDAASGNEAKRIIHAGVSPSKVCMSTQELPSDFADLYASGVKINLCSLDQIRRFGEAARARPELARGIGVRVNPGVGSGGSNMTNTGGPGASFGIWTALMPEVVALTKQYGITVERVHMHVGSGSDPTIWLKAVSLTLDLIEKFFPDVTVIDLGGGYKVARMREDHATDIIDCGKNASALLADFAQRTGRKLHMDIEPGTFLVANAGCIVATIQDIVSTEKGCIEGHTFLKLDTGMTSIMRPMLYGAQHPLVVVPRPDSPHASFTNTKNYVVVGHDCESGDLLTPAPSNPEELQPRLLQQAEIGDIMVIEGAGAYCSSMSASHYNSFTALPELLVTSAAPDAAIVLIRRPQPLEELWQNELPLPK